MPPRVLADGLGRSAPTNERNVGVAATPVVGPAQIRLADWVFRVPVNVPVLVTGLFVTVKIPGRERPTLETVPPPAAAHDVLPDPSVIRTLFRAPLPTGRLKTVVPAAALTPITALPDVAPFSVREPPVPPLTPKTGVCVSTQVEPLRLRMLPDAEPKARSSIAAPVAQLGNVAPAVGFPQNRPAAGLPEHWLYADDDPAIRKSPRMIALSSIEITGGKRIEPDEPKLGINSQRRCRAVISASETDRNGVHVGIAL